MISSTSNAQIKNIIQLQAKSKAREKQNCFIVEGIRMFMEVPATDIIKIYVAESFFVKSADNVKEKIKASEYEIVTDEVFKKISDTKTPQGIMVIVRRSETNLNDILENISEKSLFLILEDIQDPGNLGTILRTSEAGGVTGIIMSKNTVDIYNPKVVRSTMGSIFRVPFVYVDDLEIATKKLKENGVTIYAAHLKGKSNHFEKDYKKASAFMLGNEGNGLTDKLADKAQEYIRIPMLGEVESLNVANAATILIYEALRQKM
ncbi:MAG: RNA methyltransferase [Lachnospiraceae bacterium]|nr:RNA methyltransferase [Lachnospiraceae bacterium]